MKVQYSFNSEGTIFPTYDKFYSTIRIEIYIQKDSTFKPFTDSFSIRRDYRQGYSMHSFDFEIANNRNIYNCIAGDGWMPGHTVSNKQKISTFRRVISNEQIIELTVVGRIVSSTKSGTYDIFTYLDEKNIPHRFPVRSDPHGCPLVQLCMLNCIMKNLEDRDALIAACNQEFVLRTGFLHDTTLTIEMSAEYDKPVPIGIYIEDNEDNQSFQMNGYNLIAENGVLREDNEPFKENSVYMHPIVNEWKIEDHSTRTSAEGIKTNYMKVVHNKSKKSIYFICFVVSNSWINTAEFS